MVSKPKPPVVKTAEPDPVSKHKNDPRLDAITGLLLTLEETLIGSAPPHLHPAIKAWYSLLTS